MKSKIISIFLVLTMILSYASVPVFSDDEISDTQNNYVQESEENDLPIVSPAITDETTPAEGIIPASSIIPAASISPEASSSPEINTEPAVSSKPSATPKKKEKDTEQIISLMADNVTDLSDAIKAGQLIIDVSGSYEINDVTTENTIIIKSGVSVDLTINNVSITNKSTDKFSPVKIEAGANLTLNVKGENTFTSKANYYPAIAVYATESDYAILHIEGNGTLNAVADVTHGSGIGSVSTTAAETPKSTGLHGEIVINNATVNATGKVTGIGSGLGTSTLKKSHDIIINGGTVTADGGQTGLGSSTNVACPNIIINGGIVSTTGKNRGIGGGVSSKTDNGSITINGGTVTAKGTNSISYGIQVKSGSNIEINSGSVSATCNGATPVNSKGEELEAVELQISDLPNAEVIMGEGKAMTDKDGKLYVYAPALPDGSIPFSVIYKNGENDIIYYTTDANENNGILTGYEGDPCSCTEDNVSIELNLPGRIEVNKLSGSASLTLNAQFIHCAFPSHKYTMYYELTDESGNPLSSSLAYVEDNKLVVNYAAKGQTIVVHTIVNMNNFEKRKENRITVAGDDVSRFDLSEGKIIITEDTETNDPNLVIVSVGNKKYSIAKSEEINIYQKNQNDTINSIYINADNTKVVLDNIHIATTGSDLTYDYALRLGDVNTSLRLIGSNTFNASDAEAVFASSDSQLIIGGDGSLDVTSGNGPGIGRMKSLTVNSGTITASGSNGSAGIGGGRSASGINVVVNGGRVYAYGDNRSAGIGGGFGGAGGSFTINGGYVFARSGADNGFGIGDGGDSRNPGTIIFNGGSIDANLPLRNGSYNTGNNFSYKNQYLVTLSLEGITTQENVTYRIDGDENDTPILTSTDTNGKLHLYLPSGQRWIRVYAGGKTYYRYMMVPENDSSAETAVLNPVPKLKTFEIPGQIGQSVIDEDKLTVSVTVPYNIQLSSIKPQFTYDGALLNDDTTLDFNNDEHQATLTILGDNKIEKIYTVTLTVDSAPAEPTPDTFDISKGKIFITDKYVEYAGVRYNVNSEGYIITGTGSSSISVDSTSGVIPPITLRDVTIDMNGTPLNFYTNVNVTVEGTCNIKSNNSSAMQCVDVYNAGNLSVNITGDGSLFMMHSGSGTNAATVNTAFTCDLPVFSLTSADGGALTGSGSIVTRSDAYVKLPDSNEVSVKNNSGETLYQLTATLNDKTGTGNECTYNGKTYYIDNDHNLCMMVPNGEYVMSVKYNDCNFDGTIIVNGAAASGMLLTMTVDSVEYDYQTVIPYTGKDVDFKIKGNILDGTDVTVQLTPNKTELITLSSEATGSGGVYEATVNVPENESTTEKITYSVSVFLADREFPQDKKLVVNQNNTEAKITKFEIPGQLTGVNDVIYGSDAVSIYFPYDFELVSENFYTPSNIEYIGKSISPDVGIPTRFYEDVNNFLRAYYTVTANDGVTTKRYMVKLYHRPIPRITTLNTSGNPSTSAGGNVTITARGNATNYIQYSHLEKNRKVYIYSDDGIAPVEAEQVMVNIGGANQATFVADINFPENTSTEQDKIYTLKAKIGDTEQLAVGTVTVPKKKKSITGIESFNIEHQVGETVISENSISITMPYDADITSLVPDITLGSGATCSPSQWEEVDFTNPVKYTVTAENGTDTKEYTVTVTKQAEPVVTDIEFTNPTYSSAGRVQFKVSGQNLENSADAITENGGIFVKCTSSDGTQELSGEVKKNNDNEFVVMIDIPKNTTAAEKIYTVSVEVAGKAQTIIGNTTLTVPAKEPDSCELTDIILVENQYPIVINGTYVEFYVPYNTDLRSITPDVRYTGADYSPKTPQDFNKDVEYTIIAESSVTKTYTIHAMREGSPKVLGIAAGENGRLTSYAPKNVEIIISGNFIHYVTDADKENNNEKDVLEMTVTPNDGGDPIQATIEYNKYSGEAIGHIAELPKNETSQDVQYTVTVTLNGVQQDIGASKTLIVPCKKTCLINSFIVENQIGASRFADVAPNDSTIVFDMPYEADIRAITPTIEMDADTITPTGAQNFETPVEYTITAEGMPDHKYTVTANRLGAPVVNSAEITNVPATFKGGTVNVSFEGVFHYDAKVEAVPNDGSETVKGTVTMPARHKGEATLNLPVNNTYADREYTLVFYLDGFEEGIHSDYTVTVPRRTPRTITEFKIDGIQDGDSRLSGTDIYVDIPYYRYKEIESVAPVIEFDADNISPKPEVKQNFGDLSHPVQYTLSSADDEPVTYTIHIEYVGEKPEIKSFTVPKQSKDTVYEGDTITITMPSSANIKELEPVIEFVGKDYSPKGPQNFTNSKKEPIVYTIVDKYGIEQKYNVTITKKKSGGKRTTPTPTVMPTATPDVDPDKPTPTPAPSAKPYMSGYEEKGLKQFKPDNNMTRAEVATILSILDKDFDENKQYDNAASDISSDAWYANYVNFASFKGYMSGYDDGTYRPENVITRAEFASLIARYIDIEPIDSGANFKDIASFTWCNKEINALAESGIVSGYDDGSFMPSKNVTRAEAAAIINRVLGWSMSADTAHKMVCPFSDVTDSHWAYIDIIIASCGY